MKRAIIMMLGCALTATAQQEAPLQMIVMDPLALPLSCACVNGSGQRRYEKLAEHLSQTLHRKVEVTFDESLALALKRTAGKADIVIGKDLMVRMDADQASLPLQRVAALTDLAGAIDVRGVMLVGKAAAIQKVGDLRGKRVSLGPQEDAEAHAAARALLKAEGVIEGLSLKIAGSMEEAALAVSDGESDAAVVSAFLPPLFEGCGKIEKGSLRSIGETEGMPFIRVFVGDRVTGELRQRFIEALLQVAQSKELLAALESRDGFVRSGDDFAADWPDWRGTDRRGMVAHLPAKLPDVMQPRWMLALTGPAMAGAAVSDGRVIIPDKSANEKRDIFRCVDAQDGTVKWTLEYDAAGTLEYSNAPRATPVIHDGFAYLQGAMGHLHCVVLSTGRVVWKRHLYADFGAERPNWGATVPPLVVDDKVIIAPGAKEASIVALDRKTGTLLWQTPGHAAAYAAFIVATLGGKRQIVGYDAGSAGGWEIETGRRLWSLVPPDGSDFNVTTPIVLDGQLLLATENNGTRLYRFDEQGCILPEPVQRNDELAPDTCTPAIAGDRLFATAYGELFCLDAKDGLKTLWHQSDDMFHDHCSLIASADRVLLWTANGDLLLLDAAAADYAPLARLQPFADKHPDSLAHPAVAGDRLYLRSAQTFACFELPR